MAKKYADIKIYFTVSFEDDGETDLESQALNAARDTIADDKSISYISYIGVLDEVRETETL